MRQLRIRGGVCLVDDVDFKMLSEYFWYKDVNGYAARIEYVPGTTKRKVYFMHRQLLNVPKGMFTDHINRQKLDNRRQNLRICTRSQNSANRTVGTGYKGVYREKRIKGLWRVHITYKNKQFFLGNFWDPKLGALMYDFWAVELFGKFALTNFSVVSHK